MVQKYLFALSAFVAVASAALTRRVACPDGVNTATNAACCAFFPLRDELQSNLFNNECGQEVRESVRLTFHDGVGFSPTNGGGGADGSIITFSDIEILFPPNDDGGVEDIVNNLKPLVSAFNVTPGDLIYFAAATALTNCAGAPRIQFFAGRPDPLGPAPDGTVNSPGDSVDVIIERFSEIGFAPEEIVALLASHSIGAADGVSGARHGAPFDSSAHVFDSQIFIETRMTTALDGMVRLPSDALLARDERTACTWQSFILDEDKMRSEFGAAMVKLSLVHQDQDQLVDCSELIPEAIAPLAVGPYLPGTDTAIDAACAATPFPSASLTASASITSVTPVNDF